MYWYDGKTFKTRKTMTRRANIGLFARPTPASIASGRIPERDPVVISFLHQTTEDLL